MENRKIRWGLLGTGDIVNRWMRGVRQRDDLEIVAIASRKLENAQAAAEKYGIANALTYDEMLARDDIDIIYIGVPHTAHKDTAIRAMNAGKNVLVEKPVAVNEGELMEMLECAKKNNVFFMEAFWTRFFPVSNAVLKCIEEGRIGQVRTIQVTFSFRIDDENKGRLVDPMRAGGGLLDVGVYDLHFSRMILGKNPQKLIGLASFDTDHLHLQVDEQAGMIAQYDNGELSIMTCGIRTETPHDAYIYGTKGYIKIPVFWKPQEFDIVIGEETETIKLPVPQNVEGISDDGYQFEMEHVHDCLKKGLKESPLITWDLSIDIIRQCDQLRKDWNFKYPFE